MKKYIYILTIVTAMLAIGGSALAGTNNCCLQKTCVCVKGGCCKDGKCSCAGDCCVNGVCQCAQGNCGPKCKCGK